MKFYIRLFLFSAVSFMLIIPTKAEQIISSFCEWGTILFYQQNQFIGWIDNETGFEQTAVYESVDPLNDTLFIVCSHGKYGIENKSGDMLVNPVWRAIYPSADFKRDHIVFLYSNSITVAFDLLKLKTICSVSKTERLRGFYNGYALLRKPDGNWNLINKEGQHIRSFEAIEAKLSMDHYILIYDQTGYRITDLVGMAVNQTPYDYMSQMYEGIAVIEVADEKGQLQTGLMDEYGRIMFLSPDITSPCDYVSDGRLCFSKDGQYGFSDLNGLIVIEPIWDYALPFSDGLALVAQNGMYGYINTDGNVVIPVQYDDASPFINGRALIVKDGIPNIIDDHGKNLIVEYHSFDSICSSDLNDSLYIASVIPSEQTYYITAEGRIICQYVPWDDDTNEFLDTEDS